MTRTNVPHNKKIVNTLNELRKKGGLPSLMAVSAIQRGNDAARDFFAAYGADIFLDGMDLTPIYTLADFCGVSEKYARNLLYRYGFTREKAPNDVSTELMGLSLVNSHGAHYTLRRSDHGLEVVNADREQVVCIGKPGRQTLVSPRCALALVFLMSYGRSIPKDSQAKRVYDGSLRGSAYYHEAMELKKKPVLFEVPKEGPKPEPVTMTPEVFKVMLEQFSKQFSESLAAEVSRNYAERKNKKKKQLPEDWGEMVEQYNDGLLSVREIQNRTGWSNATVYKYIKAYPAV